MVDNSTSAASAGSTPLNTTLFELIVALVVPSYTLSSAVIPEVIVTAAFSITKFPAACAARLL